MLFDSLFQVDSLEMVEDLVVVVASLLVDLALPSAQELMVWPSRHVPLQSLRHPHFFHFSVSGQPLVFPLGHHWLFHTVDGRNPAPLCIRRAFPAPLEC